MRYFVAGQILKQEMFCSRRKFLTRDIFKQEMLCSIRFSVARDIFKQEMLSSMRYFVAGDILSIPIHPWENNKGNLNEQWNITFSQRKVELPKQIYIITFAKYINIRAGHILFGSGFAHRSTAPLFMDCYRSNAHFPNFKFAHRPMVPRKNSDLLP